MPLIYNGTTITAVTWNGTAINTLTFNGTTVFTAGVANIVLRDSKTYWNNNMLWLEGTFYNPNASSIEINLYNYAAILDTGYIIENEDFDFDGGGQSGLSLYIDGREYPWYNDDTVFTIPANSEFYIGIALYEQTLDYYSATSIDELELQYELDGDQYNISVMP